MTSRPDASSSSLFWPRRIISGGQTGVDRAGLESALALGIAHGGWCPAGRLAEDGSVPSRYDLHESHSREYPVRTELNVLDSDATLILYEQQLTGGSLLTQRFCRRSGKPCLCVKLEQDAPEQVQRWLQQHRPETLNVAGPRESTSPGIFDRSFAFLLRVLTK